jgi:succinate dehydrogenase/fumarate reductase cytochrome b subunit
MRHEEGAVLARGVSYLMFATSPLFTLAFSLARMLGIDQHQGALSATWALGWIAAGLVLYFRKDSDVPQPPRETTVTWLRVVHGGTALCILCGFLVAHLLNHDLAAWSVPLHIAVMKSFRLWYRSEWVQPVLLGLFVVMICTGFPMVLAHSRRRMDAFRVVQAATGVYVALFVCSHVLAAMNARSGGMDTNWFFAAGRTSLLDGSLLDRLIPYYVWGTFFLVLHVACGLRGVLLQHGVTKVTGDRALYGLAGVGLVVTVLVGSALLGFHLKGAP